MKGCGVLVTLAKRALRVLRSGDMEYVMLHLYSVYLMPGEGQPAAILFNVHSIDLITRSETREEHQLP